MKIRSKKRNQKHSCFRKCGWREKSSPGQPQIYFFNQFSRYILFSSLVSFAFFDSCFSCWFLCCFLKLKMYILVQIRLCGWLSDKTTFTWPISGNKTTFFLAESLTRTYYYRIYCYWHVKIPQYEKHLRIILTLDKLIMIKIITLDIWYDILAECKQLLDFSLTSKSTLSKWCKKLGICYKQRNKKK